MDPLKNVQKKLDAAFGGAVTASLAQGVLTLDGALPAWQQVVDAGRLCAAPKRWSVVNRIRCTGEERPATVLPQLRDDALAGAQFDVAVIGAGVVGCAVARELSRWQLRVVLLEKEHDVALHASSRNDGMVHPGIDLKKGTRKQEYNRRGNAMYDEVCRQLGVPFRRTGQILGLPYRWMAPLLPLLRLYWLRMGVPCEALSRAEALRREPGFSQEMQCALAFPTAGVVCPYGLTIAYAENAVQNGVRLSLDTAVTGMEMENGRITALHTNRGTCTARVVVNAAGVFSEDVAEMAGDRFFSIHPRKGTNAILDKKAARKVHTILSLLGTADTKKAHTKGGGIVSTVDGNVLVGPDAVETPNKEDFSTERASVAATFAKQGHALPTLSQGEIITYFTGVRAPTYEEDFVIEKGRAAKNLVHAAGIQSPGLTAAPAIAQDVAKMAVELLGGAPENPAFDPVRAPIPRPAQLPPEQRDALIRQNPDYGVIVCRCEEVSKGEILDALRRPVPCDTVDGVKRRVRPGMGRCQGGFCGPLVTQLIAQERGIPLEQVKKSGDGSQLLVGGTKEGGAGR